MIDNKIVAKNHQKMEKKCPIFKEKSTIFWKFFSKVFHNPFNSHSVFIISLTLKNVVPGKFDLFSPNVHQ